ncbi:hypothetical protein GLOIN_2v1867484 [Rhizophagus clarus]|uniref:Uncharacterized protein n=1 Tax=Rhizophagus clarus TaxID=94130 RepID=A0A8H3LDA8_9GLOM|nr:hypothetical protein GLOIN_2v1867484 [Rhizophagus clarus]
MSRVSEKDRKLDNGDIYRESEKAYEYEACLTTTIYGDTYLDPEKCKVRGFRVQFEEFLDKVLQRKEIRGIKMKELRRIKANQNENSFFTGQSF